MTGSTVLGPRFKAIGLSNHAQAQAAVKRLTALCSQIRHATADAPVEEEPSTSSQPAPANVLHLPSTGNGLCNKMQQDLAQHFIS